MRNGIIETLESRICLSAVASHGELPVFPHRAPDAGVRPAFAAPVRTDAQPVGQRANDRVPGEAASLALNHHGRLPRRIMRMTFIVGWRVPVDPPPDSGTDVETPPPRGASEDVAPDGVAPNTGTVASPRRALRREQPPPVAPADPPTEPVTSPDEDLVTAATARAQVEAASEARRTVPAVDVLADADVVITHEDIASAAPTDQGAITGPAFADLTSARGGVGGTLGALAAMPASVDTWGDEVLEQAKSLAAEAAISVAAAVMPAERAYEFAHLGSPYELLSDSVAAFVEESAMLPATIIPQLATSVAAEQWRTHGPWVVTFGVVAADVAILAYAHHRRRRAAAVAAAARSRKHRFSADPIAIA